MRCLFLEILVYLYANLQTKNAQNVTLPPTVLTVEYFNVKIELNYKYLFDFLHCLCNFKTCTLNSHPLTSLQTRIKRVRGHDKYIKLSDNSTIGCTIQSIKGDDDEISVNVTCHKYHNICTNRITITNSSLIKNSKCLSQCFEIGWEDSANTKISLFDTDILTVDNCTSQCIHSLSSTESPSVKDKDSSIGVTVIIVIAAICILLATFIVMFIFRYRSKVNTSVSAESRYKIQNISNESPDVFKTSQYCLAIKFNENESSKTLDEIESRCCGNSPKTYNFSPPIRQPEMTTSIGSCNQNKPGVCKKPSQQSYPTETDELNTQDPEQSNENQNVKEFYDPKIYYDLEIQDD